jgi:hypothetical protein
MMPKKNNRFGRLTKKGKTPLIAIILIMAIVGGLLIFSNNGLILNYIYKFNDSSQCSFTYSLYGIDDNGNRVEIPTDSNPLQSAFLVGGVSVPSINVGLNWTASGKGVQWNTLTLHSVINITMVTGTHETEGGPGPEATWGVDCSLIHDSTNITGSWINTLVLGHDIASNVAYKVKGSDLTWTPGIGTKPGEGWYYKFSITITGHILDELNTQINITKDLGSFGIWIQYDVSFTINGNIPR